MRASMIRRFVADPAAWAASSDDADAELWRIGLRDSVDPATTGRPLMAAQRRAYEGFAQTRCGLLLGPPGTGKTALLAWMIVGYVESRLRPGSSCRVLVTGFTREAIHNVLAAVRERLTRVNSQAVVCFAGPGADAGQGVVETIDLDDVAVQLDQHAGLVLGMTTWSSAKMLAKGYHGGPRGHDAELFDLVCVDEASQIQVGQGLMALAALKEDGRLVVAGDDQQLPPIGAQPAWSADTRSLTGSLYDFLQAAGVPTFALRETFRLNRVLAAAPSELFYESAYASAVPDRRLALASGWQDGLPPWLVQALDPEHPVCILLHDGPPATTKSPLEAAIVAEVAKALAARIRDAEGREYGNRLWQDGLAIVSPHRAQNAEIRQRLSNSHANAIVETVERIQGRERDAVVVCYSVADTDFAKVEARFLFSPNRFNVAITRPRTKLIIVVSRQLLTTLPSDEDDVESVQRLREYVFASQAIGNFNHEGLGRAVKVELRLRRFDESLPLPDLVPNTEPPPPAPAELTPQAQEVLEVIRSIAAANTQWGSAASFDVKKKVLYEVPFDTYRDLFRLGHIVFAQKIGQDKPFLSLFPLSDELPPIELTPSSFRNNYRAVCAELATGWSGVLYEGGKARRGFRDRFVWCDVEGKDLLWPMLAEAQAAGLVTLSEDQKNRKLVSLVEEPEAADAVAPPTSALSDSDFAVLNQLEDLEIQSMSLGVFETWRLASDFCRRTRDAGVPGAPETAITIAESIERLVTHGHVLANDGRIRSRMAELARELRYVKQRFRVGDQATRPYLVRALKVAAKTRQKPRPTIPFGPLAEEMAGHWPDNPDAQRAIRALVPAMAAGLGLKGGREPLLSGFQRDALVGIAASWMRDERSDGYVITADTGSGKTEAACLPLLFGATLDFFRGIQGARAILVYPRIRLAVNQSERLVRYAKALNDVLGVRAVTVGIQHGSVPQSWAAERKTFDAGQDGDERLWVPHAGGGWKFPFFPCPVCDAELTLEANDEPAHADTLRCHDPECGWSFAGWVGTKTAIRAEAPSIFLMVTESLHQWMQKPAYGGVFGDEGGRPPPRAVLADEIHLYSHQAGAQVGWMLRRLIQRLRTNGEARPIAIGMSATLGDPRAIWSALSGFPLDAVQQVQPAPGDRVPNPRGREYFYFAQPEIESRGKDVAGASTTLQAVMLLARGVRRRMPPNGGFRTVVFVDSIDKLRRLHSDFYDAETKKRLWKYRTNAFGANPQDPRQLVDRCCGEPRTCRHFLEGECWWHAATDEHQRGVGGKPSRAGSALQVVRQPIFSGTSGNVDKLIESSDVVFATSSLEVGYDDPAITLVYQHYAPMNLASFVQRKGRGGRGADDRPTTGTTLSLYSPRDSYLFQDPDRLLNPRDFHVPLNMNNVFVRRGQVLAAILDAAARVARRQVGVVVSPSSVDLHRLASSQIESLFGLGVWQELGVQDFKELWEREQAQATEEAKPIGPTEQPYDWHKCLKDYPKTLFAALGGAHADVHVPGKDDVTEDVGFALVECAPGRISRRFGSQDAHWVPVGELGGPWARGEQGSFSIVPFGPPDAALPFVPVDVIQAVGQARIRNLVLRPRRLHVQVAGRFEGADWTPQWGWRAQDRRAVRLDRDREATPIHHKTQGRLLGFSGVVVDDQRGRAVAAPGLPISADGQFEVFESRPGESDSGLRAWQVYWASDVEVVLDTLTRDREYHRQRFGANAEDPTFIGYGMQPEGVRLRLDSTQIDAFIAAEIAATDPESQAQRAWHEQQFKRYRVFASAASAQMTQWEGKYLAELTTAAAANAALSADVLGAIRRGNYLALERKLLQYHREFLPFHPQLSQRRLERITARLKEPGIMQGLADSVLGGFDDQAYARYLRSTLLHGLLVRLTTLFVVHGMGDERRVLGNARPPLQFPATWDDNLVVCERSSGGDGTARAFAAVAPAVLAGWADEGFVRCPNARVDAVLSGAQARTAEHERWRTGDPRNIDWVAGLAAELNLDSEQDSAGIQAILQWLFHVDEIEGTQFAQFDAAAEIAAIRNSTVAVNGLAPGTWELVSTVVQHAREGSDLTPVLAAMLAAYGRVEEALDEERLAPEARLAEYVYRIGTPTCEDGCPACVQTGSDLMGEELAAVATSRRLLERFGAFVRV